MKLCKYMLMMFWYILWTIKLIGQFQTRQNDACAVCLLITEECCIKLPLESAFVNHAYVASMKAWPSVFFLFFLFFSILNNQASCVSHDTFSAMTHNFSQIFLFSHHIFELNNDITVYPDAWSFIIVLLCNFQNVIKYQFCLPIPFLNHRTVLST